MKLTLSLFLVLMLLLGHASVDAVHPKVFMNETGVENSFLIFLKGIDGNSGTDALSVEARAKALVAEYPGITVTKVYDKINAFYAKMTTEEAEAMADSSDEIISIQQNGKSRIYSDASSFYETSWGLDRVDQRRVPLDDVYSPTTHGKGVTVYVIDSGIDIYHKDFGGRATWGTNLSGDNKDYDCQGHGTFVAGIVAGETHGIGKEINVVAVKVYPCDGDKFELKMLIEGIVWVRKNAKKPAVANLSIGNDKRHRRLESEVKKLIRNGVPVVVAAGNDGDDACKTAPGNVKETINVGNVGFGDVRVYDSSIGKCVDIFAPGENVHSTTIDGEFNRDTGTSFSAPHVSGAVALLLEAGIPSKKVKHELLSSATKDVVVNAGKGSPNRLLYIAPTTPPTPSPSIYIPPSCVSGEAAVFTSIGIPNRIPNDHPHSITKVKNLKIGDTIRGFDSNMAPASCKVEAIGSFGFGEVYGNYTADHFVFNPDSGKVEQHGMTDTPSWEEKFDLISDCPLIEDEAGKKFSPIDSDFCGGDMKEMSWKDYTLLHSGILSVVRRSGAFWFQGSSYTDMAIVQQLAPRVCKNMLKCIKANGDTKKCRKLENISKKFVDKALRKSARMKALKAFSGIGYACKAGSVAAVVTYGKTVDESLVGTEAC